MLFSCNLLKSTQKYFLVTLGGKSDSDIFCNIQIKLCVAFLVEASFLVIFFPGVSASEICLRIGRGIKV